MRRCFIFLNKSYYKKVITMLIQKGDIAPFNGILITEKEYRVLLRDKKLLDEFEKIVRDK